jgi:hypothetical protein
MLKTMKKSSIIIFYWIFITLLVFPQHNREAFRVSMENNRRDNQPNLESKGDIERLFFGDFNAPVEFFYFPAEEEVGRISPAAGLRVVRDSLDSSYILEVKYITNFAEVLEEVERTTSIGGTWWNPWDGIEERDRRRNELRALQQERRLQLFTVNSLYFPVSQLFAEKLREKAEALISTFEEENPFPENLFFCDTMNEWIEKVTVVFGGYAVTFRTVVDDEVWSLWIHLPQNKALELSNLFRQIIVDAQNGQLDEVRYKNLWCDE